LYTLLFDSRDTTISYVRKKIDGSNSATHKIVKIDAAKVMPNGQLRIQLGLRKNVATIWLNDKRLRLTGQSAPDFRQCPLQIMNSPTLPSVQQYQNKPPDQNSYFFSITMYLRPQQQYYEP